MRYTEDEINAFQEARHKMVGFQIAGRGVKDARVLSVMRDIPRHLFVTHDRLYEAYQDRPVAIECGQTISQPYMVAVMTETLQIQPQDHILEIGTGSGYQTAVLARLARKVVTVERHSALANSAKTLLEALGYDNITVVTGDGSLGFPEEAPYEGILVTAGAPRIPSALPRQLAEGGRLVLPVGDTREQTLITVIRHGAHHSWVKGMSCRFVPLVGEQGWHAV